MTLPWSLGLFSPVQNGTIAATTSSQAIALGGSIGPGQNSANGPNCVIISNVGTVEAFVAFGDSAVTAVAGGAITAAADGSAAVPAGVVLPFQAALPGITHVAAITASGATTLRVSRGFGS